MKTTKLTMLAFLLIAAPVSKSWGFFGSKNSNYLNGRETADQARSHINTLQVLQQDMTLKFNEIESELARGNTQRALSLAKFVLDTVKVKTGIDPKMKLQEKFLIPTTFPKNAKSMTQISESQKELVIRTIADYRGGLYLDIMNLSKRTTLLYIKAFQAQLSKTGGLTQTDKEKIINDLVKASIIPMPVEDKNKTQLTVFDDDVANEDHVYLFNRELKMFLLQNAEVKISEQDFELRRHNLKRSYFGERAELSASDALKQANTCMKNANGLSTWTETHTETFNCFKRFYERLGSIKECYDLADRVTSSSGTAEGKRLCYRTFNP